MSIPISQFIPPHPPPPARHFPPWCPYVCSLHLCLFLPCKPVHLYIFLDSTYMRQYTIFVFLFLTYFTLYDCLYVHPHLYKWPNFVPFYGWVVFHCIYVPILNHSQLRSELWSASKSHPVIGGEDSSTKSWEKATGLMGKVFPWVHGGVGLTWLGRRKPHVASRSQWLAWCFSAPLPVWARNCVQWMTEWK